MSACQTSSAMADISINREGPRPAYIQLSEQVRDLIVQKRLVAGLRMPSSRDLASEFGMARKTVVAAYDQLIAEGYLSARQGSGTFVEAVSFIPAPADSSALSCDFIKPASTFGEALPLSPSTPDMSQFPRTSWARAAAKGQRNLGLSVMFEAANGGYAPLREAIADHLWVMRGISCAPEQVIVTSGLRESLGLICQTLLTLGQSVCVENPGYQAVPQILEQFGMTPKLICVDDEGIDAQGAIAAKPDAVVVSASRHFPMGMSLSLPRRAELVKWAVKTGGWLIEDDYDCEFRFGGEPLQSIFAMDRAYRTLYLGSLSKTLFPRLRISFMIAPPNVTQQLIETQNEMGSIASLPAQAALAEFIHSGQYANHIRHMRKLYRNRCEYIAPLVRRELTAWVEPRPVCGGFHFAAPFTKYVKGRIDDVELAEAGLEAGIGVRPLSVLHAPDRPITPGILIGFAGTDETAATKAVTTLKTLFKTRLKKART